MIPIVTRHVISKRDDGQEQALIERGQRLDNRLRLDERMERSYVIEKTCGGGKCTFRLVSVRVLTLIPESSVPQPIHLDEDNETWLDDEGGE